MNKHEKPWCIYDDQHFFDTYVKYRAREDCLNNFIEQPQVRSSLPCLLGKDVLDIGCGMGYFCRHALASDAANVVGLDASKRMIEYARARSSGAKFYHIALEDYRPKESYDVVVSSLVLHYVCDIQREFEKIWFMLNPGGTFAFSVNHPIHTANISDIPPYDSSQSMRCDVDNYFIEGPRVHHWIVDGVVKFHRTIESYVSTLLRTGFILERLIEPHLQQNTGKILPHQLSESWRRPWFLILSGKKPAE